MLWFCYENPVLWFGGCFDRQRQMRSQGLFKIKRTERRGLLEIIGLVGHLINITVDGDGFGVTVCQVPTYITDNELEYE